MARIATKKMKSKYGNYIRIRNKVRKLDKHLATHKNDLDAKKTLKTL